MNVDEIEALLKYLDARDRVTLISAGVLVKGWTLATAREAMLKEQGRFLETMITISAERRANAQRN